jgi:hypothetical protein
MRRSPQLFSTLPSTTRSRHYRRTFRRATKDEMIAVRLVATVDRLVATTTIAAATTGATTTTEAVTWATRTTATSQALLVATWEEAWATVLKRP